MVISLLFIFTCILRAKCLILALIQIQDIREIFLCTLYIPSKNDLEIFYYLELIFKYFRMHKKCIVPLIYSRRRK